MSFRKLGLLVWKGLRLRRYHLVLTLLEIVIPVGLAALFFYSSSQVSVAPPINNTTPEKVPPVMPETNVLNPKLAPLNMSSIVYAPSNNFTDQLMNNVNAGLGNITMEKIPNEALFDLYILNHTDFQGYAILFRDLESDGEMPDKLSYVVRSKYDFATREFYKMDDSDSAYMRSGFSVIQQKINNEFTKIKTNHTPSSKQILFQIFPTPAFVENIDVTMIIRWIVIVTILLSSLALINDVIEEKNSGVKELMKMTGLDEWLILLGWFTHAILLSIIVLTIFVLSLKVLTSEMNHLAALYPILWLALVCYCIANVSYCLTFCAIFHNGAVATSIFFLTLLVLVFTFNFAQEEAFGLWLTVLCLFPVVAFWQITEKISYYVTYGQFSWSALGMSANDGVSVSALFAFFMLILDAVLFLLLALYINAINPGKFGIKKSPLFIFKNSFLNKNDEEILIEKYEVNSRYIEPPSPNLKVSIQIEDLYKKFNSTHAVNGVNLNIYNGEITALLGHNGAGKTTTLSILTGSMSPSAGTIYYKNEDIFENMAKFRDSLGLCPQENRLMAHLSVKDHLMFFGKLKGLSNKEAQKKASYYLELMEMKSKESARTDQLSGGMKRKLCLAISLMGDPNTLILDEPTSGMDVQSRRKIWDLLLAIRGNRTIILTTHHMEEADALGDRLTIMHQGRVICHGTSLFLKKAFGTGYELTITKTNPDSSDITRIIETIVPGVKKDYENRTKVVYILPLSETGRFMVLFENLEASQSRLKFKDMGVTYTTMEHVFLKAGDIFDKNSEGSSKSVKIREHNYKSKRLTGVKLAIQQIIALFIKKFLYSRRNLATFFTKIIIPTIVLLMVLKLADKLNLVADRPLDLSLESYPSPAVMLRNGDSNDEFYRIYSDYVYEKGGYIIDTDSDVIQEILNLGRTNILAYKKNLLMATEWNASYVKLMYNPWLTHSAPIAIDTLSNVLLRNITDNNAIRIETTVSLIEKSKSIEQSCGVESGGVFITGVLLYVLFCYYTTDVLGYTTVFLNVERFNGFKHIQLMSNLSPFMYWIGTFLFDLVFIAVILLGRIILLKISGDRYNFIAFDDLFGSLTLYTICFAISGLPFVYCLNHLSWSKEGTYTMVFLLSLLGSALTFLSFANDCFTLISNHPEKCIAWYYPVIKYVILLIPPLNYAVYFVKFLAIWLKHAVCMACYGGAIECPTFYALEYPSGENSYGVLPGLHFLLCSAILYGILLSLLNTEMMSRLWNTMITTIFGDTSETNDKGDDDVQKEYQNVQNIKQDATQTSNVSLLVDGLRKNYIRKFKPFTAVSDVSFIIPSGGCFGLLGVNGAGKTTSFRMLTGEIVPTKGESAIKGFRLRSNRKMYLSLAGYCPQQNSFLEQMTGRELLTLIAKLEGYFGNDLTFVVDKWLSLLGLEEYQNRACGNYSGGNKRKLCAAMALAGNPHLVFLDEPTAGVDPVSKRKLYDMLKLSKESGQAIVLTSHSMEECEAICDRLTIMVDGVMKCIGSPQHLKSRYAQGYSVMIKVHDDPNLADELTRLKQDMVNMFRPEYTILKDEHKGLLYYQITNTSLPWSRMFGDMETIKRHHGAHLVEEYILTDTSLEEVFMSFADKNDIYSISSQESILF